MNLTRKICAMMVLLAAGLPLGGCMSSTLNSVQQSEAVTTSNTKDPTYDPFAREQAVAEMRAKAENRNTQNTNAFQSQDGPARPLTSSEANAKIRELNASSSALSGQISDEEMAAKQRSIEGLRRKAKTHYSDALKKIEN